VYSALFLIVAFVSSAVLWLLLEAEFLAITLVLVYVGAVMVLFLFVVMMLDINATTLREGFIPLRAARGNRWRHPACSSSSRSSGTATGSGCPSAGNWCRGAGLQQNTRSSGPALHRLPDALRAGRLPAAARHRGRDHC
jgi:hypothetical protein